ncbi:MAG TPA: hypothetical protein VGP26_12855 [Actinophytocola sp.]|nr:hypothetical protein [Actinophytocola sp.]
MAVSAPYQADLVSRIPGHDSVEQTREAEFEPLSRVGVLGFGHPAGEVWVVPALPRLDVGTDHVDDLRLVECARVAVAPPAGLLTTPPEGVGLSLARATRK